MKLRVFEAFAGYGSQSIALRNIGVEHEVVAISEIDKYALQAYYSIHDKNIPNLGDISKIKVEDIPKHDLFTYSFPCQDISVAGKRGGIVKGETRSGLLYECERIIEYCKPKYLLMENVKNLVGKKFKAQFDEWLAYLETLGYTNYWQVLNAKDYGVPQNRERVFVISILGEHKPYEFPKKIKLDKTIKDILEENVDEKYYINKPFKIVNKSHKAELDIKGMDCLKRVYDPEESVSPTLTAIQGGNTQPKIIYKNKEVLEKSILKYERTDYGKQIRQQYERGEINEKIGNMRQLTPRNDGVSNTLTTVQKDNYVLEPVIIPQTTPQEYCIRKLTPREYFRLMGMKDSDIDKIQEIGISNSQQYKMAGNSIVINVLEEIFKNLFDINN